MTYLYREGFRATAYWGPRDETPENCATYFQQLLAALSTIHPSFSDWSVFRDPEAAKIDDTDAFMEYMNALSDADIENRIVPFASMRGRDVAEWIAERVSRNDDGTSSPVYGYRFSAGSSPERQTNPREWSVSIHAGSASPDSFVNTAELESQFPCAANVDLNTLQIFKPAMLTLATTWGASWCGLRPAWSSLNDPWFGFQWATYLGPALAKQVTPPSSALTEHFPDGGLLMVATEDRFDPNDPKHMAAAQDIIAALAPVGIAP